MDEPPWHPPRSSIWLNSVNYIVVGPSCDKMQEIPAPPVSKRTLTSIWPKSTGPDKLESKRSRQRVALCLTCAALIVVDGAREDKTGFTMRLAAVILPELGTGPDVPIVVSHWFAARGTGSGKVNGWWRS